MNYHLSFKYKKINLFLFRRNVVINLLKILKLFANAEHNNEQHGNNVINLIVLILNKLMMLLVMLVVVVNQQQSHIIDVGKMHIKLLKQIIIDEEELHKKRIEDYFPKKNSLLFFIMI